MSAVLSRQRVRWDHRRRLGSGNCGASRRRYRDGSAKSLVGGVSGPDKAPSESHMEPLPIPPVISAWPQPGREKMFCFLLPTHASRGCRVLLHFPGSDRFVSEQAPCHVLSVWLASRGCRVTSGIVRLHLTPTSRFKPTGIGNTRDETVRVSYALSKWKSIPS